MFSVSRMRSSSAISAPPASGGNGMVAYLYRLGHAVNRNGVQRLMRTMGLAGMAPGPNTGGKHAQHKVYPYLLRGVDVERPDQVWGRDVTFIRLAALRSSSIASY